MALDCRIPHRLNGETYHGQERHDGDTPCNKEQQHHHRCLPHGIAYEDAAVHEDDGDLDEDEGSSIHQDARVECLNLSVANNE